MRHLRARDEREVGLDLAGDRLAYLVVSYGLLVLVAYRGFVQGQTSWELLALVVLGGLVSAGYRLRHQAMTPQAWMVAGLTIVVALAVSALLGLGIRS